MRRAGPSRASRALLFSLLVSGATTSVRAELLHNGGFEAKQPESWMTLEPWVKFDSTGDLDRIEVSTNMVHSGKHSARIVSANKSRSFQGLFQQLPIEPAKRYRFAAFVQAEQGGNCRGQISIEWTVVDNELHREFRREWGPDWSPKDSGPGWKELSMTAEAPRGVTHARFVITQFDADQPSGGCSFLVDDASVTIP